MKNKKGFTLPELLAVILLISLIAAMALTSISKKSKELKNISQAQFEKLIKSSAKLYVEDHINLKDEAKAGNNVEITYTTLKNAKLLSNNIKDLTTFKDIPIECYSVNLNYNNYKYNYTIIKKTDGNCN